MTYDPYRKKGGPRMSETKQAYCDRLSLFMTREMRPGLFDLAVSCDCGFEVCRGWKLKTVLRTELPEEWRSKLPASKQK